MNEAELAEQFNRKLDGLLAGEGASFSPDPGALELAAALFRADFSPESAIKESLRERLAGREEARGAFGELVRGLLRSVYARSALAAACLLLAISPLVRRPAAPVAVPAHRPAPVVSVAAELPPLSSAKPARRPVVRAAGFPLPGAVAVAPGIFAAVPMAALRGEPIQEFPIESAGRGNPEMVRAAGREIRVENGSGIVLETEHAVFTFERRVITPDELFQRRSL